MTQTKLDKINKKDTLKEMEHKLQGYHDKEDLGKHGMTISWNRLDCLYQEVKWNSRIRAAVY